MAIINNYFTLLFSYLKGSARFGRTAFIFVLIAIGLEIYNHIYNEANTIIKVENSWLNPNKCQADKAIVVSHLTQFSTTKFQVNYIYNVYMKFNVQ